MGRRGGRKAKSPEFTSSSPARWHQFGNGAGHGHVDAGDVVGVRGRGVRRGQAGRNLLDTGGGAVRRGDGENGPGDTCCRIPVGAQCAGQIVFGRYQSCDGRWANGSWSAIGMDQKTIAGRARWPAPDRGCAWTATRRARGRRGYFDAAGRFAVVEQVATIGRRGAGAAGRAGRDGEA